jgi:hypothetical protein
VIKHDTVPVVSVVPEQVSSPLSVSVTGSLAMGADVMELVRTPDTEVARLYSPVAEFNFNVVGVPTPTLDEALDER